MRFYERFEHTIDPKGRLVLPASYRPAFTEGGYVVWLGNYAALFTEDGWEKHRRKIEMSDAFSRTELQRIFSMVSPFTPDAQHRIVLNQRLRERAGLEREVSIVGTGTHAAIYPSDVWDRLDSDEADDQTLADKLEAVGV